uniref:Uncharacterized protein n=1 Tax=Setaria viridis TaxID=4556 RepID=A0A4U6WDC6_SETVI|nr:hypothetical protein SEVIR_2G401500v2 [Setaria viridis]
MADSCSNSKSYFPMYGHWPSLQGIATLHDRWIQARSLWNGAKRKGFDSLVALVTWEVWKERTARIFRGERLQMDILLQRIKAMGELWILGGAVNFRLSHRRVINLRSQALAFVFTTLQRLLALSCNSLLKWRSMRSALL